jgi:hypothetical protein
LRCQSKLATSIRSPAETEKNPNRFFKNIILWKKVQIIKINGFNFLCVMHKFVLLLSILSQNVESVKSRHFNCPESKIRGHIVCSLSVCLCQRLGRRHQCFTNASCSGLKSFCIRHFVFFYFAVIKYSTIPRSNPRYTRYHHKAYILSLKQQNKKKQNDGCKRISNPNKMRLW